MWYSMYSDSELVQALLFVQRFIDQSPWWQDLQTRRRIKDEMHMRCCVSMVEGRDVYSFTRGEVYGNQAFT